MDKDWLFLIIHHVLILEGSLWSVNKVFHPEVSKRSHVTNAEGEK